VKLLAVLLGIAALAAHPARADERFLSGPYHMSGEHFYVQQAEVWLGGHRFYPGPGERPSRVVAVDATGAAKAVQLIVCQDLTGDGSCGDPTQGEPFFTGCRAFDVDPDAFEPGHYVDVYVLTIPEIVGCHPATSGIIVMRLAA
jgi:hypothetical protein